MTEQEINLLARYYCQPIERYISLKKQLNNLSGFSKKLSYYNYSLSNDLIGKTKTLKQLIKQATSEIPYYIDFDIIVKAYKKLPIEVKNKPIDKDLADSLDRILKREELMNKLPNIDRKFKFSYLSIIYKVIGVDIEKNIIEYKSDRIDSYKQTIAIDTFLNNKENGIIKYL